MTGATAFSIPPEAMGWWHQRLQDLGVEVDAPVHRGDEDVLMLRDPDGIVLELVATEGDTRSGWDGVSDIPADRAVRGLHSITLSEQLLDPTASMLTDLLGMEVSGDGSSRARFVMSDGGPGTLVDVAAGASTRGLQAGGTVHHVAYRAPDLETMATWRELLTEQGVPVTEIRDRRYFKSIYFREPGGVLFEIATDAPGFDVDEPLLELGRSLQLPPWLEPSREEIAASLPPIELRDDAPGSPS
jgi:glyoxalase family protein